jgi:pimeloyl-ACP methyl ester carboxylesterase
MAQTRYLPIAGGLIAYDDSGGGGPLVVLVPGLGDRRGTYRFLVPLLVAAGYRAVTMDLRGHGESSVPWNDYTQTAVSLDIVALLTAMDSGPAVLVGHSYAGGAVIWAAAQAPVKVAGIVLAGSFIHDIPLGFLRRLTRRLMASSVCIWSLYYHYAHRTARPADLAAWRGSLSRTLREPGRKRAMAVMMLGATREGERWAPSVNCPALVIMGTNDPNFPGPAEEAVLQARLLSGEAELIDGAGHYPHSEFPDRMAQVLLPFLKQAFPHDGIRATS